MTLASILVASLMVVDGAPARPLVARLSKSLRCEMQCCEATPPTSLALPPSAACGERPEAIALWIVEGECVSCLGYDVALGLKTALFVDAGTSPLAVPKMSDADGATTCLLSPKSVPVATAPPLGIVSRGTRTVSDDTAAAILARMVFDGLCDGSLQPRLAKWRPWLLDMLTGRLPVRDFDRAFDLLLGTFPGSDDGTRALAVQKWAAGLSDTIDSADVFRALTRHYIASGEYDLAIGAADAMVGYHAGYLPNALYLKGHSHAFAGRFTEARQCLVEALALRPSGAARARILYLQAWILLQEGETSTAVKILKDVVAKHPSTKYARQARTILDSL